MNKSPIRNSIRRYVYRRPPADEPPLSTSEGFLMLVFIVIGVVVIMSR